MIYCNNIFDKICTFQVCLTRDEIEYCHNISAYRGCGTFSICDVTRPMPRGDGCNHITARLTIAWLMPRGQQSLVKASAA